MKKFYFIPLLFVFQLQAQNEAFTIEHDFPSAQFEYYTNDIIMGTMGSVQYFYQQVGEADYERFAKLDGEIVPAPFDDITKITSPPIVIHNYLDDPDYDGFVFSDYITRHTVHTVFSPEIGNELLISRLGQSEIFDINPGAGSSHPKIIFECTNYANELVSIVFSAFDGEKRRVYLSTGFVVDVLFENEKDFIGVLPSEGSCFDQYNPNISYQIRRELPGEEGYVHEYRFNYARDYYLSKVGLRPISESYELTESVYSGTDKSILWSTSIYNGAASTRFILEKLAGENATTQLIIAENDGTTERKPIELGEFDFQSARSTTDIVDGKVVGNIFFFPNESANLYYVDAQGLTEEVAFQGVILDQFRMNTNYFIIDNFNGTQSLFSYQDGTAQEVVRAKKLVLAKSRLDQIIVHGISIHGEEILLSFEWGEEFKTIYLENSPSKLYTESISVEYRKLYLLSERQDGSVDLLKVSLDFNEESSTDDKEIVVYPNPFTGGEMLYLTEDFEGAYEILSMTGQSVAQGEIDAVINGVAVPNLTEGMYILRIGEKSAKFSVTN